jgi:hypothetical protein
VKDHLEMSHTIQMLDSNFTLAFQLFQLLKRLLLAILFILRLWLGSLVHTSLPFTNDYELRVYVVKMLWLKRCPPKASEFVEDPNMVSKFKRLRPLTYSLG